MSRNIICLCTGALLSVLALPASAQQSGKIPRIGYVTLASLIAISDRTEAFRQGLRELGYVEGKDIIIEWRSAEGKRDRLPALISELVKSKIDVIVTAGGGVTRPAKQATSTIPIVMAQDADPVGNGFVASLARPGGNITGLSNISSDLVGKRLELLKEIVPKLTRVAVFGTSTNIDNSRELKELENTAGTFGMKLQYLDVLNFNDFTTAFRTSVKWRADAVLMIVSGPVLLANLKEVIELAVKHRLPVQYTLRRHVEAGGLMSYGVNLPDLDRRAATYVDKILKGRKPADLPVEQPVKFELVFNLKAAKQIGLTIPPNVLVRADRVIR